MTADGRETGSGKRADVIIVGGGIGGIAAAPLGAFAAKRIPAKAMLILVGAVLTITSAYGVWSAWS